MHAGQLGGLKVASASTQQWQCQFHTRSGASWLLKQRQSRCVSTARTLSRQRPALRCRIKSAAVQLSTVLPGQPAGTSFYTCRSVAEGCATRHMPHCLQILSGPPPPAHLLRSTDAFSARSLLAAKAGPSGHRSVGVPARLNRGNRSLGLPVSRGSRYCLHSLDKDRHAGWARYSSVWCVGPTHWTRQMAGRQAGRCRGKPRGGHAHGGRVRCCGAELLPEGVWYRGRLPGVWVQNSNCFLQSRQQCRQGGSGPNRASVCQVTPLIRQPSHLPKYGAHCCAHSPAQRSGARRGGQRPGQQIPSKALAARRRRRARHLPARAERAPAVPPQQRPLLQAAAPGGADRCGARWGRGCRRDGSSRTCTQVHIWGALGCNPTYLTQPVSGLQVAPPACWSTTWHSPIPPRSHLPPCCKKALTTVLTGRSAAQAAPLPGTP